MSISQDTCRPRVVVDPGMRRSLLHGNGRSPSPSPPVVAGTLSGRPEAVADDECEGEVGPARSSRKRANKAASAAAELVERRGGAKENAELQSTVRTQSREAVSQAQARIREAVIRNRQGKLTALLHHLTIDVLRASFFGLKKSAAPGVDEMTWTEYAEHLEANLWTCMFASIQERTERCRRAGSIFRRRMADSDRSASLP